MSECLAIRFTPAEGTVLRMLGVIERRGYVLRSLAMTEWSSGASMIVGVQPRDSSRRLEVVVRQLDRIIGVNSVSIIGPGQGQSQGSPA